MNKRQVCLDELDEQKTSLFVGGIKRLLDRDEQIRVTSFLQHSQNQHQNQSQIEMFDTVVQPQGVMEP